MKQPAQQHVVSVTGFYLMDCHLITGITQRPKPGVDAVMMDSLDIDRNHGSFCYIFHEFVQHAHLLIEILKTSFSSSLALCVPYRIVR